MIIIMTINSFYDSSHTTKKAGLPREPRTVVEDASVGQQQGDELGVLLQLHGVLALVGEQCANVDGEVHLVGQAREQRQHQLVVVARRREVRRQPVALAEIVCGDITGLLAAHTHTRGGWISVRANVIIIIIHGNCNLCSIN